MIYINVLFDLCLTRDNKKRCNQFDYNVLFWFACDPAGVVYFFISDN